MQCIIGRILELKVYVNITPHIRGSQVHFMTLASYCTAYMQFNRDKGLYPQEL